MKALADIRSAFGFISILPVGRDAGWSPLGMIRFFPLVGLVLGGLLLGFDCLASLAFGPAVVSVMDTIVLILLTGAFHLDGLGDAADGLFSHRPKERVMEIMKDSRIGMMGLVTVVCVLALKTAGIYSLKTTGTGLSIPICFLIIPAYARGAMLFGIRFLNYGRQNTGTGLDLFEKPLAWSSFFMFIPLVLLSLFTGTTGIILNIVFGITVAGLLLFYKRKLNCITGDMLGAMTETVETVLFLSAGAVLL